MNFSYILQNKLSLRRALFIQGTQSVKVCTLAYHLDRNKNVNKLHQSALKENVLHQRCYRRHRIQLEREVRHGSDPT